MRRLFMKSVLAAAAVSLERLRQRLAGCQSGDQRQKREGLNR